jgi:hypothetical protein
MLARLALLVLVFSGPAAVGAYLLSDDGSPGTAVLAAIGEGGPSVATTASAADAGQTGGAPVLAGVLYTAGTALVDWNGVRIPVEDGSYAYLGGEVVSTGPDDMAVLRLDADNSVYMCPSSRISVDRGRDGDYRIKIAQGGGRFAFAAGTDYRIEANRGLLSPGAAAASEPTVAEVTVFEGHPGGVVCTFSSTVDVAGYSSRDSDRPIPLGTTGPGEIVDLSRALRAEAAGGGAPVSMRPIPMPEDVQSRLLSNAAYPSEPGPVGYLCRCEELKRYAEADGIPDTAMVPRMSPPGTHALAALPASGSVAPAALPELPRVAVAAPGPPNPVDLGVMVEPASGGTSVTVPPPLVPVAGSGGGLTSTPS